MRNAWARPVAALGWSAGADKGESRSTMTGMWKQDIIRSTRAAAQTSNMQQATTQTDKLTQTHADWESHTNAGIETLRGETLMSKSRLPFLSWAWNIMLWYAELQYPPLLHAFLFLKSFNWCPTKTLCRAPVFLWDNCLKTNLKPQDTLTLICLLNWQYLDIFFLKAQYI